MSGYSSDSSKEASSADEDEEGSDKWEEEESSAAEDISAEDLRLSLAAMQGDVVEARAALAMGASVESTGVVRSLFAAGCFFPRALIVRPATGL